MSSVIISGTGCFEGIFSLQVKDSSQPNQEPPRRVVYALQEPQKEELERPQKQQIIIPMNLDKMTE